jgi:hypothetical protein
MAAMARFPAVPEAAPARALSAQLKFPRPWPLRPQYVDSGQIRTSHLRKQRTFLWARPVSQIDPSVLPVSLATEQSANEYTFSERSPERLLRVMDEDKFGREIGIERLKAARTPIVAATMSLHKWRIRRASSASVPVRRIRSLATGSRDV